MNRFLYLPLLFPCIFRPSYKFNTVKKSLYLLAISLHILPTIEDTSYRHCKMLFHVSFPRFYQYRFFFSFTFCSSEYIYFFHTHHPRFLTSILFFIATRSNGDFYFIKDFRERKDNTSPFSYVQSFIEAYLNHPRFYFPLSFPFYRESYLSESFDL